MRHSQFANTEGTPKGVPNEFRKRTESVTVECGFTDAVFCPVFLVFHTGVIRIFSFDRADSVFCVSCAKMNLFLGVFVFM